MIGLGAGLFLLAALPRMFDPISRANLWYRRAFNFYAALGDFDWAATYRQHHPGVTTMWLSGAGMKLFQVQRDVTDRAVMGHRPDATEWGVVPLAIAVALCIVLAVWLMRRLFNHRIALYGGLFLAIDPFFLAYSKVLHVDALLACFMMVSLLFLLDYQERPSLRALAGAGVFMGLGVLTKSPALFVCPFAALLILLAHLRDRAPLGKRLQTVVLRGALLIGVICATCFLLFPAMWVRPLWVVQEIIHAVTHHTKTAHGTNTYWLGDLVGDPGRYYYLAAVAMRTTLLSLPMAVAALVVALDQALRPRLPYRRSLWTSIAFGALFLLMMSIAAKKSQRYVLPVFPVLDLLAAVGLHHTVQWFAERRPGQWWQRGFHYAALGLLALSAVLVLARHPHYGLHANALLGGPRVAKQLFAIQHQGEGLESAAAFLAGLPPEKQGKVAVCGPGRSIVRRILPRATLRPKHDQNKARYRVYYLDVLQRRRPREKWRERWRNDQLRKPTWTFERDGITYVWIYEQGARELNRRERQKRSGDPQP